jgi:hypothetical protein
MIVLKNEKEICSAFDPTNSSEVIDLQKEEWTPLTTTRTEKPLKR